MRRVRDFEACRAVFRLDTKGRHHSRNNRCDDFFRMKVYAALRDLATGIGQRSRAV